MSDPLPIPEKSRTRERRRRVSDSTGVRERAFVAAWDEHIRQHPGFLQHLLPREETELGFEMPLTQAETRISREVISWLGSNFGMNLIEKAVARDGYVVQQKDFHSSLPHIDLPVTLPAAVMRVIQRWPNAAWMYSEDELRHNLSEEELTLVRPYLWKSHDLFGLDSIGNQIRNSTYRYYLAGDTYRLSDTQTHAASIPTPTPTIVPKAVMDAVLAWPGDGLCFSESELVQTLSHNTLELLRPYLWCASDMLYLNNIGRHLRAQTQQYKPMRKDPTLLTTLFEDPLEIDL